MNFLRIDHTFINVSEAEDIQLIPQTNGDIEVLITYRSGKHRSVYVGIDNDNIITTEDAVDSLAESIQEAIQTLTDADCENIEDYFEAL